MPRPVVTVYVPCHNYGRFLGEALESVFSQIHTDWELLVIIDGSTDDSRDIAESFCGRAPKRVHIEENDEARGLRYCANLALQRARGRYIVRLDADDYFDEAALLVLAGYLDSHPEVSLVYPNWFYISESGEILATERRKVLGKETNVLDLPPHGAGTMVRTSALKAVGGYDPAHDAQDGHELWLKILNRYRVANVTAPLFYYRQHSASLSRDDDRLLASRRDIKRSLATKNGGPVKPKCAAVIPAKNTYPTLPNIVLDLVAGKPLIDHTIDAAIASDALDLIYVYTDDPAVVEHCERRGDVTVALRSASLSSERARLAQILASAVHQLEQEHDFYCDIVVTLSVHTPLRGPEYIREAIDTLLLYDVDSVISTYEDFDLHFTHGRNGMEPLNPGMINELRLEREALYVANGAVHATWRDKISEETMFQGRVGHVVMPRHMSYYIKSPHDLTVIAATLEKKLAVPRSNR